MRNVLISGKGVTPRFLLYLIGLISLSKGDTLFKKCTALSSLKKASALGSSIAAFISATLQRKVGARPLVRIVHNSKISSGHCLEFLF